ncbi:hypothetical protein JIN85_19090 [Luteolibacter pohnpeiensis]|uniref:Uncharacterized protein n=1 Tax=Luteolibacter pohnpeiensis TaxID=454153 RepID=A0A934S7J4_9BACT|nr:hypothetical protein [Luteolibacter pohnpeiensis]
MNEEREQDAACQPLPPFSLDDFPKLQPQPRDRRSPSLLGGKRFDVLH